MKTPLLQKRSSVRADHLVVGAVVNFFLLAVLIILALIREQPLFWRNAGGWPIWLRDLVGGSFYPLFMLEFLLLIVFSVACAPYMSPRYCNASSAAIALALLWGLFLLVIGILAANNLENLFTGRPVHWHAD